jgi:hypothetical protein
MQCCNSQPTFHSSIAKTSVLHDSNCVTDAVSALTIATAFEQPVVVVVVVVVVVAWSSTICHDQIMSS